MQLRLRAATELEAHIILVHGGPGHGSHASPPSHKIQFDCVMLGESLRVMRGSSSGPTSLAPIASSSRILWSSSHL